MPDEIVAEREARLFFFKVIQDIVKHFDIRYFDTIKDIRTSLEESLRESLKLD